MNVKVVKAEVEEVFKDRVQDRAKKEGRTEAAIIRKALNHYLATPIAVRK